MSTEATPDFIKKDTDARALAIDPTRSFIVEAPAGAGKTELLTQRFLALLAKVQEPEEIVALTFTNKAAAEMRHRIVSSLQMAHSGQLPAEVHKQITFNLGLKVLKHDQDRHWGLLLNSGRLQITTLDAFCSKLARQMPLLSRLGSQPAISMDAERYYAQAALATLEQLEQTGPQADAIERVLDYFDNDSGRFQGLLVSMLASRDQWLRHSRTGVDLQAAEQALGILLTQELSDILVAMPMGWQTGLMPVARAVASHIALSKTLGEDVAPEIKDIMQLEHWTVPLQADSADLPQWYALVQLLFTKTGGIRSAIPAAFGLSDKSAKHLKTAFKDLLDSLKGSAAEEKLKRITKLPNPRYNAQETQLIADLVSVLQVAVAHLWQAFKQAGEVDFTEIAQRALEALGQDEEPTDLALQLDYRLNHLLVDEFQDTSPTQVQLLEKLTAEWMPGDGKSLFLVGDPMQSIYKFRKADVGLFLKVQDLGLGNLTLQALRLYRNNRSSKNVVDWVNRVFPRVFAAESNSQRGAVKFSEAIATKPESEDAGVRWHPLVDELADEDDQAPVTSLAEREAEAIVRIVQQTQQAKPDGTIAILVRARTHLEALVQLLRTRYPGLKYQAIEIESLASRQLIQDLLCLTRALLHRGDRTQWLALLRAPWCGLLLQDLHVLAAHNHRAAVWDLMQNQQRIALMTPDGQERLLRVRAVLAQAFEHQGRLRLRRWVEGVWQALGGPYCLAGAADLQDAKAFLDVLDLLDESGSFELQRLETEVGKLYAAPDPAAGEQLQIMTVHKSKGLEFDTVIIPGLHKKSPTNDKKLLLWDEVIGADNQEHLVIASLPFGRYANSTEPHKFDFLHQFDTERARNETQRLLYVAVTRAKQTLHLVGCAKPDTKEDGAIKAPAKDSFLGLLWADAALHFKEAPQIEKTAVATAIDSVSATVTEPEHLYNHQLVRLKSGFDAAVMLSPIHLTTATVQTATPSNADNPYLADVGTLVHRYLQLIAEDGLDAWPQDRLVSLQVPMVAWMLSKGHDHATALKAAQEVGVHLSTTLQSEHGRWVLAAHPEAACEKAYTTLLDGRMQTHIIDRMFVADGVRWIIDFKTTTQVANDSAQVRLAFAEQLRRYRALFSAEEVRMAVFFTFSGTLVGVG